ncbi:hypothetical protein VQH23_16375 [Pararoseomonas sp. SCSIO 73927]|uniref:hypothetical protein n=1 Tax=Pararoseomonas sp. SCSIO 73927 TaxID=3114537 RepID=UPI0030CF626D
MNTEEGDGRPPYRSRLGQGQAASKADFEKVMSDLIKFAGDERSEALPLLVSILIIIDERTRE